MSSLSGQRARLHLIDRSASPEEAAAIVGALERFVRATAPPPIPPEARRDLWREAALREGVERAADTWTVDSWINT